MNRVGIDIGSTTVKIAIIDEQNKILFSAYERHYANIQETLRGIIERAYEQLGDQAIAPMITGSGGMFKGVVAHIGEDLKNKPGFDLKEGDKIVSLVSLSMTPLKIEKILAIHKDIDRVDIVGKAILFEGQLGALRDLDYGIYPYTTSSNTIGAYAPIGAGIPGHKLHNSIGVMKAYSSCVGDGPFTAELAMTEEEKHALREAGHEYGAATGRPRRVGPIDLVASRYGVFCQGCDEVALTLLDVLDYMEKIPMVTAYKLTDGTTTTRFPMGEALDTAQPVVEYLPGWHCDITAARKWEDLPKEAQAYVEHLEKAVGCKITYISVGAEREAYIHRA